VSIFKHIQCVFVQRKNQKQFYKLVDRIVNNILRRSSLVCLTVDCCLSLVFLIVGDNVSFLYLVPSGQVFFGSSVMTPLLLASSSPGSPGVSH